MVFHHTPKPPKPFKSASEEELFALWTQNSSPLLGVLPAFWAYTLRIAFSPNTVESSLLKLLCS